MGLYRQDKKNKYYRSVRKNMGRSGTNYPLQAQAVFQSGVYYSVILFAYSCIFNVKFISYIYSQF